MSLVYDYLCVDQYLQGIVEAQAVSLALSCGLIDELNSNSQDKSLLSEHYQQQIQALPPLLDVLQENQVIELSDDQYQLTDGFRFALQFRDLIEEKIRFGNVINTDFIKHGDAFFTDLQQFMQHSETFRLFDYGKAMASTPENYEATASWVRYTTIFTRYEAPALLQYHDFSGYKTMLDIGGNSGEFSLQICRQHQGIEATVVDLPVVCEVGQNHIDQKPEAGRINFLPTNVMEEELPDGYDIVTIKSLLHDWPEDYVPVFLEKAINSLKPGGTILIYERITSTIRKKHLGFSMLPILVFQRFYRSPDLYIEHIQHLGMTDIQSEIIELDMPFVVLTATKPK